MTRAQVESGKTHSCKLHVAIVGCKSALSSLKNGSHYSMVRLSNT